MRIISIAACIFVAAIGVGSSAVGCSKSAGGKASPEPPGGSTATSSTSAGTAGGTGGGAAGCTGALCSDAGNCGTQGHSCLGGGCAAGICLPFVLSQSVVANQLFLDASNVYVGMALVPVQGQPCSGQARIAGFARATGLRNTIVPCGAVLGENDDTLAMIVNGSTIYWSILNEPNDAIDAMYKVSSLDDGTPVGLGDSCNSLTFGVDDDALFYSRTVNFPRGIARMNLDGTGVVVLSSHSADFIATDGATVYFSEDPCFGTGEEGGCEGEPTIYAVPKAGGDTTSLAVAQKGLYALLQQDGYLYWYIRSDDGSQPVPIQRVPTTGGVPSTITTSPLIQALAVDATSVYWIRLTGYSSRNYEVVKAPIAGGEPTVLFSELGNPSNAVAVDDTAIVWSAAGKLYLLAK